MFHSLWSGPQSHEDHSIGKQTEEQLRVGVMTELAVNLVGAVLLNIIHPNFQLLSKKIGLI